MNLPTTSETYLLFRSGERTLALPTRQTRQVLPLGQVSPLPASGGSLLGLSGALGRAVPVVNLAAMLGSGPAGQQANGSVLGLLCEDAGETLLLPIDEVIGSASAETSPQVAPLLTEREFGKHAAALLGLSALIAAVGGRMQSV
ncbi:hypothetical protein GCM10010840_16870 [Deinococcus aerolatus]|uniref:CheW-like domain-containing protein n=1 Tax=Deinococcus aerolatus TaxID=522487 RepID=A0ABQ2G832_9DEIO|nr:chemotaxis protein CheW [Deinococcus aerolatus]GGL79624.1 hypothetical protein GCM10010840_16870 [Deinococcus aerolatus]